MDIFGRMKIWKKLLATTISAAPAISVTQIPTFKVNLFSDSPSFVQDLQLIINKFNEYLFLLSGGKVGFSSVWASSGKSSSLTGSLKNIYVLSEWMYGIISVSRQKYSISDMTKIMKDLYVTTSRMDFADPMASSFKSDIMAICQVSLNKLSH